MAAKKDIIADLDFLSDRISTQVRTVSLSIFAVVWLFLVGGKDTPVLPSQPNKNLLLIVGAMCLIALLLDYFQYVAGYANSRNVLNAGEAQKSEDFKYDYNSPLRKLRDYLFTGKQVFLVAAFALLSFTIGKALLH
jgi:hypothetical protein